MTPESLASGTDTDARVEELEARNRELSRRVKEFETLLDLLPVGVAIASDPTCSDIRVNQALASMLGADPAVNNSQTGPKASGTTFRVLRNGKELSGPEQPIQLAARENRQMRDVEVDVVRADGSVVTQLCFAQPLFDDQQAVRGSIGVVLDITERRKTERALRESEERYRFLAEAIPQMVWVATSAWQILYINSHWVAYTGFTLEQTQTGIWAQVIHPGDLDYVMAEAEKGRAKGLYNAEYRLRRADGAYRWHLGRSRRVEMPDGSQRWLGTAIDIHDLKQSENERLEALLRQHALLQEAEQSLELQRRIETQLLLLVEASSTLMASTESGRTLNTILNLARRFVGADAYAVWRKVDGGPVWKILADEGLSDKYSRTLKEQIGGVNALPPHPVVVEDVEDHPLVTHRLPFYREEGIRAMLSVPLCIHGRLEGSISFYYRSGHKFSDLETRVAGGLANLAAAALGNAELYEKQIQLRVLAESAERRAYFLAEAGRVLSSSLDIETTLASVADLAVPAVADWATVEILDESGELHRVALKHADPAKIELAREYTRRFLPNDSSEVRRAVQTGTSVLIREIPDSLLVERIADPEQLSLIRSLGLNSLIVAPLMAAGRTFGALTFITAESGRVYDDSDLMLAEELAGRAATAVANARLYKEQKNAQEALQRFNTELKRANEDVNQFAYSASHDLREPLRMITIYSQLLELNYGKILDGQAHRFLDYVIGGARRMDMLIRDILAYTQAAAVSRVTIAPFPVSVALAEALRNLDAAIAESGAVVLHDDLPSLPVQEIHLIQLFQNLISNAVKYRSEAPPRIRISAERLGEQWKISVQDNGIGIAPQYANQIFGIFTRLHTAEKYAGTGIGLAICLKIVERYGGQIKLESEEGRGSIFWFTLPATPDSSGTLPASMR
jgi:PAS domain S-box-containing protein